MGDDDPRQQRMEVPEGDRIIALAKLRQMGIDTAADPDPLIDLAQIATLASFPGRSYQKNTVEVWRQRSRPTYRGKGKLLQPFPEPDIIVPKAETGFLDKPKWRAITTIVAWLIEARRWHPDAAE